MKKIVVAVVVLFASLLSCVTTGNKKTSSSPDLRCEERVGFQEINECFKSQEILDEAEKSKNEKFRSSAREMYEHEMELQRLREQEVLYEKFAGQEEDLNALLIKIEVLDDDLNEADSRLKKVLKKANSKKNIDEKNGFLPFRTSPLQGHRKNDDSGGE